MEETQGNPKTSLAKQVQNKEIKDVDELLNQGRVILESEVIDGLIELETELLLIGQSKGKFGGGQRRVFRQTQKKTREGNKPRFTTFAVVGDKNGHIGMGYGKSKETVLAREKAIRKAKISIFTIKRGSGSWESQSSEPHSIPFAVEGKCGSVIIRLMPAPKGTGLCIEKECAKILEFAGIKDVWSKTFGQTKNKMNLIKALEQALKKLVQTKVQLKHTDLLHILTGSEKIVTPVSEEEAVEDKKKEEGKKKEKEDAKTKPRKATKKVVKKETKTKSKEDKKEDEK
ncbi:MAG: 30S ribosomal protein S5 [archaeon]